MSLFTRCPYCRRRKRIDDLWVRQSVVCARCGLSYSAEPLDEPQDSSSHEDESMALVEPKPAVEPMAPVIQVQAPSQVTLVETPITPRANRRVKLHWRLGGALSCLLGAFALAVAAFAPVTFLTKPLSGMGLMLGFAVLIRYGLRTLPVAGTLVSAAVLAAAFAAPEWLGPVYVASQRGPAFVPQEVIAVPIEIGSVDAHNLLADGWADASRAALHHDRVRVQVAGVTQGSVEMLVPEGASKESYLAISLVVQHLGHGQPVLYIHWGAGGAEPIPHPTLTQAGRKLVYRINDSEVAKGQVRQGKRLYPGKAVEDVLLFEAKATLGESLRLELPAEAWGGKGVLRFTIPAAMIRQAAKK